MERGHADEEHGGGVGVEALIHPIEYGPQHSLVSFFSSNFVVLRPIPGSWTPARNRKDGILTVSEW